MQLINRQERLRLWDEAINYFIEKLNHISKLEEHYKASFVNVDEEE